MRTVRIGFRYPMKALESLGQIDRSLRNTGHERTLSNTRPRNQKFSNPAQSARLRQRPGRAEATFRFMARLPYPYCVSATEAGRWM